MGISVQRGSACTNFLVTKGASTDGSTMVSYAADSHYLYGELYHWPAARYPKGALYKVYEWDTGRYLGEIAQAERTYNVVGNINEHQLTIGETTYGGRKELVDTTGIVDYGTLIYVTLQRARNAREAIKTMIELVSEYGYASGGESFSIADGNEVWIFEMIGKGTEMKPGRRGKPAYNARKGAAFVALRIPDGYISAHANQARITTFPKANGKTSITDKQLDKIFNPEVECVYAHDVVDFAKKMGYFNGKHEEFSFSDTYNPLDFGGARGCEQRVWAFFRRFVPDMDQYFEYAAGWDLKNRMPLWVKPSRKIDPHEVMDAMRDHLEGTPLDMTKDPGAGPHGLPYRWRPMYWEYESKTYCNERATATQQTGFVFVAQSRSWLPSQIGGILWFGMDDADATVFTPMYCSMTRIPLAYQQGNGSLLEYSNTSAFWLFNKVTNFTYLRYDLMHADLRKEQLRLEKQFLGEVPAVDRKAQDLFASNPQEAVNYLTTYSNGTVETTMKAWNRLFEFLLIKYIDGNVKVEENGVFKGTEANPKVPVKVLNPDYPDWWKKMVIDATGDKLEVRDSQ